MAEARLRAAPRLRRERQEFACGFPALRFVCRDLPLDSGLLNSCPERTTLSSSAVALKQVAEPREAVRRRRLDVFVLAGILVALAATVVGIALTGVKLT